MYTRATTPAKVTAPAAILTSLSRIKAGNERKPRTASVMAIKTSHRGESPRMSTITIDATAVDAIRPSGGWVGRSRTMIRPPVHKQMAALISRPLGLTTEPKMIAVGVAVTATARRRILDRDQTVAKANARPRNRALSIPLTIRIRYTAASLLHTSEGRPTIV